MSSAVTYPQEICAWPLVSTGEWSAVCFDHYTHCHYPSTVWSKQVDSTGNSIPFLVLSFTLSLAHLVIHFTLLQGPLRRFIDVFIVGILPFLFLIPVDCLPKLLSSVSPLYLPICKLSLNHFHVSFPMQCLCLLISVYYSILSLTVAHLQRWLLSPSSMSFYSMFMPASTLSLYLSSAHLVIDVELPFLITSVLFPSLLCQMTHSIIIYERK